MTSPILLGCRGLTKSYGERSLFDGLSFSLYEGDHVGLVGPNGAGKSTLLKILAGLENADDGECVRRKSLRVGYVPQHPEFSAGQTAASVVGESLAASVALSKAGFVDPGVLAGTLSGGWRTRLAIAGALATEPDVLLLDEPTNHLDLESILWLESLLANEPRAFVVISHDRYFLQNVCHRMVDLDRVYPDGLLAVKGSYADLLEARNELLSSQASYEESLANRVRREVAWLRRGAKARTSKSRARIQSARRSMEELAASRARRATDSVDLDLASSGRRTKRLWSCRGLGKRFGDRQVVDGLDLLLTPGMRLGVLGPIGSGKTTLLRMIVGDLEPDAGEIRRAEELKVVYFDQNRESLDPDLVLKHALAPEGDGVVYRGRPVHVVTWARRFMFRAEQLELPVSRLSGGERARIVLARMMLRDADLLVLDEPTNDLDIPTLQILEDSLLELSGALVFVTHDRHLVDRVATAIVALDGRGGVKRFADYPQWETHRRDSATARQPRPSSPRAKAPRPRRLSYLEQREWEGMEQAVLAAEARLKAARERAEDPAIASEAAALESRMAELAEARERVDRLYARWAELEEKSSADGSSS